MSRPAALSNPPCHHITGANTLSSQPTTRVLSLIFFKSSR